MKKRSLLLVGLSIVLLGGFASAELAISDLFSSWTSKVKDAYQKLLTEYDTSWWYINDTVVTCDVDGEDDSLVIKTPVIYDDETEAYAAPVYRLFVSKYNMEAIKNGEVADADVVMQDFELASWDKFIELPINSLKAQLDDNQVYYAFIVPLDEYDGVGTPSEEICFIKSDKLCLQWEGCATLGLVVEPEPEIVEPEVVEPEPEIVEPEVIEDEEHYAANCVGMDLANVTHVINNNTITLLWTAVDGDNVKIAVFDPDEESYKDLGTTKMSNEKFSYQMTRNGEHIFMLTNGCKEVVYKVDASIKTPEEEPGIVTPATGPAENMLVIIIAVIALYGIYALFIRKNDN